MKGQTGYIHGHLRHIQFIMIQGVMVSTPLSTIFQLYRGGVLLEETAVPGENQTCHRQTLSHNVVSSTPRHERGSNSQL